MANLVQPLKSNCPYYHSQHGLHYPWLEAAGYGVVTRSEFMEGASGWIDYEQIHQGPSGALYNWWIDHCQAISHDVTNLAADHITKFVNPQTRTILMRLTLTRPHGTVITIDSASHGSLFEQFFLLEEQYARQLAYLT